MKRQFLYLLVIGTALLNFTACDDVQDKEEDEVKIEKSYEDRVKEAREAITKSPQWMADEEKKAKERGISVDSMIMLDARWMVDEQDGKHKDGAGTTTGAATDTSKGSYEQRVKNAENTIRNTPTWLAEEQKKAKERNISVDSMILLDARWVVDEEDGKHKQ